MNEQDKRIEELLQRIAALEARLAAAEGRLAAVEKKQMLPPAQTVPSVFPDPWKPYPHTSLTVSSLPIIPMN